MRLIFKTLTTTVVAGLMLTTSGCALKTISEQSEKLNEIAEITGQVHSVEATEANIIVAALTKTETRAEIISQVQADSQGNYKLNLLPGNYLIGAYIDKNDNNRREPNESASMYKAGTKNFTEITLNKAEHKVLPNITILQDENVGNKRKIHYSAKQSSDNIGKIVSLNDSIFAKENVTMGLWRPIDFLREVGGGLFFLQAYDAKKTPVLFVHGISGSPAEFSDIIAKLDQDKFQPWVLYYPSGVPLEIVSNYLLTSLKHLQEEYQFNQMQLISHSMGGLVTRTFLREHQQSQTNFDISLYVTINSPLLGMDSALKGVENSPIVIASWRDLATGSDYIKAAHQWQLPKSIPYHLFFSYLPGEEGDGVVPLKSQLSLSLQEEALRIYGSQAQHANILKDKTFIERLNKVILNPNS
ncbi:alpha/beta hydrolase [Litorilituus sediminis]|uniref:Alpha/beta hydrolase n=1 Tax=Litorilituus sediminis TaxID=718192 RepID=A0A4P6P2G2_9GAMM|nr:alpha/beta hydrolase [Litorilituus sediminis]QBG35616.1 alpha/beta hydrolase [Litorilituus sediminis]